MKLKKSNIFSFFAQVSPCRRQTSTVCCVKGPHLSVWNLFLAFVLLTGLSFHSPAGAFSVQDLTVESQDAPTIDVSSPRFSWKLRADSSEEKGLAQTAWQIQVTDGAETVWDSGRVESNQSLFISYAGRELKSSTLYRWKVRVWNQADAPSDWSGESVFLTGILKPEEWRAKWIAMPEAERPVLNLDGAFWIAGPEAGKDVTFEKQISLETADPQKIFVRVALAADQKFELFINGKKAYYSIGMVFNPDQMRFFDVTDFMRAGENRISVRVTNSDEKVPALLARIDVFPVHGTLNGSETTPENPAVGLAIGEPVQTVRSDASWCVSVFSAQEIAAQSVPEPKDVSRKSFTCQQLAGPDGMAWGKVRRRTERRSPAFEKHFTIEHPENVKLAVLHCTGVGYYSGELNDFGLEQSLLAPSPTRYDRRVLYHSFDVTDILRKENRLNFFLGHGWYDLRTVSTWNFDASPWRDFPRMIAQLEIRFQDGSTQWVVSDESWDCVTSPVRWDCIRQGVILDYQIPHEILAKAEVVPGPKGKLVAERCPSATLKRTAKPTQKFEPKPGVFVFGFEKNQAGFVSLTPKNFLPTDRVRLRYSERIHEDGSLDRENIEMFFHGGSPFWLAGEKGSFQTDWFTGLENGSGDGDFGGSCHPPFTYHGFQFVEVTVFRDGKPFPGAEFELFANQIATDFPQTGTFRCSNETLNALQDATIQAYESNFVNGFPTDCPHREKNGWTGDAQLACEQAQFNFENTPAYRKWLDDLTDEQQADGNLPGIVPSGGWGYAWGNGPAWDSALVLIPWYVYCCRGDEGILAENYDAMRRYVDFTSTKRQADGLVSHGLSDWCSPGTKTGAHVTSSGYWYLDARIVARSAEILGKKEDAARYDRLADEIRDAFNARLHREDGTYDEGSLCALSCALHQGLADSLSAEEQKKVFDRLVEAAEKSGLHCDFGILGSKYFFRTLSEGGRTDLALATLLNETDPSYVRMAQSSQGTLWEHFFPRSSLNHIMFGDFSAWLYEYLAGIQLAGTADGAFDGAECLTARAPAASVSVPNGFQPAFRRIRIAPCCAPQAVRGVGLRWVEASVESPYGTIRSAWKWDENYENLTLKVTVPPNSQAKVVLPNGETHDVTAGDFVFSMKSSEK